MKHLKAVTDQLVLFFFLVVNYCFNFAHYPRTYEHTLTATRSNMYKLQSVTELKVCIRNGLSHSLIAFHLLFFHKIMTNKVSKLFNLLVMRYMLLNENKKSSLVPHD